MWAPGPAVPCRRVVPAVLVVVVTSGPESSMPLHCLLTLSKQLSETVQGVSPCGCQWLGVCPVFYLCVCRWVSDGV